MASNNNDLLFSFLFRGLCTKFPTTTTTTLKALPKRDKQYTNTKQQGLTSMQQTGCLQLQQLSQICYQDPWQIYVLFYALAGVLISCFFIVVSISALVLTWTLPVWCFLSVTFPSQTTKHRICTLSSCLLACTHTHPFPCTKLHSQCQKLMQIYFTVTFSDTVTLKPSVSQTSITASAVISCTFNEDTPV